MNKIAVFLPIGAHEKKLELVLAYSQELIDQGNDITFISCSGTGQSCIYTKGYNKLNCLYCKKRYSMSLDAVRGQYKHFQVDRYKEIKICLENPITNDNLKSVCYKGVNIGYGALSTFVSRTRKVDVSKVNANEYDYINKLLSTSANLVDYFAPIIHDYDKVVVFNARLNDTRCIYELCIKNNIHIEALEINFDNTGLVLFSNCLPHNIPYNEVLMRNIYNELGFDRCKEISDDFFNKRVSGIPTDICSYTAHQNNTLLPESWDVNKNNIVIFNSSEDEFISIGGEWEIGNLFRSQIECLKFLRDNDGFKKSNICFYLRIHPNLINGDKKYIKELLDLQSSNFFIIHPESKISSYKLLFESDKVITFGSSMGVEATYWGKPSILIGKSFYVNLDISYWTDNLDELCCLIKSDIPAKDKVKTYLMPPFWLDPGRILSSYEFKDGKAFFNNILIEPPFTYNAIKYLGRIINKF
ncbi:hypothetical protein [Shewanella xiamenensis]|uniref:hypothetical protein n=1 Tax=Shewanella xiamenensis TaxID=332186 RepID=UPI002E7BCA94|nr:hypothetical protein [Shewanella xiamenensis]MEE1979626.1 hypothetical protein [Shewanella xiamenensis]